MSKNFRSNRLRLPQTNEPLILVGPGTGIAPFRGFWQELEYNSKHRESGKKLPEVVLYTGCRSPQEDFLFHDEMQHARNNGVLSDIHCAFSRVKGKQKVRSKHNVRRTFNERYQNVEMTSYCIQILPRLLNLFYENIS